MRRHSIALAALFGTLLMLVPLQSQAFFGFFGGGFSFGTGWSGWGGPGWWGPGWWVRGTGGTGLRLAPPLLWLSPLALDTPLSAAPMGISGLCRTTTVLASAGLRDDASDSNSSGTQGEVT